MSYNVLNGHVPTPGTNDFQTILANTPDGQLQAFVTKVGVSTFANIFFKDKVANIIADKVGNDTILNIF